MTPKSAYTREELIACGHGRLFKPEDAQLLHESGIPEDVFIALIGAGDVGSALLKQPVDGVFFTGSYGTGRRIAETVRGRMIKLQLELGGKDPVYVCEDVDVAKAAAGIADDKTYIGPLTRSPQVKVLVDVDHSMAVMREESFGPVIGLMAVKDDGEAQRLMNDTAYGLTAGVYSANRKRAEKILGAVNSGSVYWNCCDRVSPRLPWSGVGHSGVGVTLSTYGIETFTRPKAWHLKNS